MSETASVPQVEGHEFQLVFANYGQTMSIVQSLESILKQIVCLYSYLERGEKEPMNDEACEKIFTEHDNSTLGTVIKKLEARMGKVDEKAKEDALRQLGLLREARNSLAHSYLMSHAVFIQDAEGRELVIAQLRHYAQCFKIVAGLFNVLLHHLLDSLIGSSQLRAELMGVWNEAVDAARKGGVEYFRKKLQSDGVI
jgi:hypothetical protein